jgi:hypothetical protein
VKFTVEPAKISYLGRLDPRSSIDSIIMEAQRTGKTSSAGGQLRLMKDNVIAPMFFLEGALPADQALALAKKNGFASNAPVVATEIAPASFKRRDKTDITGYCQ